jgi:trehalose 6-phosphate synthase
MNDSPRAKARRMRIMRRQVLEHDIDRWAELFLEDLSNAQPMARKGASDTPSEE